MEKYTMAQAAKKLGVSKSSLFRWEKTRKIAAPKRLARTNARIYTGDDIETIREWMERTIDPPNPTGNAIGPAAQVAEPNSKRRNRP